MNTAQIVEDLRQQGYLLNHDVRVVFNNGRVEGEDGLKLKRLWVETLLTPSEVIAVYLLLGDIDQTTCVCEWGSGVGFAEIMTAAETVKGIKDHQFDFRQFCDILDSEQQQQ